MSFILNCAMGIATGVLTGFGIGGGTLLMIYMLLLTPYSQLTAQGINLLYFLPTASSALVSHVKNRLVERRAFFWAGGAGVIATALGAVMVGFLDTELIHRGFGVLLIIIGVSELFRKDSVCKDKS